MDITQEKLNELVRNHGKWVRINITRNTWEQ